MRYYSALIRIGGDQNHQAHRLNMPAPELRILQAVHGLDSVVQIRDAGMKRTPDAEVREYLEKTYGHTKVGIDQDRGAVLTKVYPSWPHVDLPDDARKFIDPMFFAEKTVVEEAREGRKERQGSGPGKPGEEVGRNTYWVVEGTGELGMTEKGEVLPEGVKVINRRTWDELKAKQEEQAASQEEDGNTSDDFME